MDLIQKLIRAKLEMKQLFVNLLLIIARLVSHVNIGPFAHIRPESTISDEVKIGNFVEIKKAVFGKGSKASHLSYIGDAEVGNDVNIGCGSITVNYDGKNKYLTKIEDECFYWL